jgi:hypothetical protein
MKKIEKIFENIITALESGNYSINSLLNILALTCVNLEGTEECELFAQTWKEKRKLFIDASNFSGALWENPTAHHARFIDDRIKTMRLVGYKKLSTTSNGLSYFYEKEFHLLLEKSKKVQFAIAQNITPNSGKIERVNPDSWNPIGDWKSPWLFVD